MQKIVLPISKCIPGMITAQPIIDLQTGTTIIGQNQLLTEEFLKNIPNFIYDDIWIYLDSFDKVWQLPPESIEKYKQYGKAITTILDHLREGEDLDLTDFEALCQTLPFHFPSNPIVLGCTNLIEELDYDTYTHSLNVAFLCFLIAKWAHYDEEMIELAIKAGLLHDLGLLGLASTDLTKLSPEEQIAYEKHPIYSFNMVSKMKDLHPAIAKAILAHHEHCDGSGFPLKLPAPHISKLAKVVCLADTYENLHKTNHIFEVLRILLEERLTWFDPELLFTFCHTIANYYIGSFVTLNSGDVGEVIFINPRCLHRPIIRMNERFVNLYEQTAIQIVSLN